METKENKYWELELMESIISLYKKCKYKGFDLIIDWEEYDSDTIKIKFELNGGNTNINKSYYLDIENGKINNPNELNDIFNNVDVLISKF